MADNFLLNRRDVLKLGLGTLTGMGAVAFAKNVSLQQQIQSDDHLTRNFNTSGKGTLKERAAAKGLIYGAAIRYPDLSSDSLLAAAVAKECGMLVPEWELKWSAGKQALRPNKDNFDFRAADWMANFANSHNLLFRGHTLVWHDSLPPWFKYEVNRQNAELFLTKHINKVVGHYAGRIHSWDVVNEAIALWDKRSDNFRKTPWLEYLGTDYIELAFRLAAIADPKALLVYNDYDLDYDTSKHEAKRNAVLNLLQRLKSKGTPVHALGIQAHLSGDSKSFNAQKFRAFLGQVAGLGLKIMITEMDVKDDKLPKDPQKRDQAIASAYEDYLSAALDEKAVNTVITWGLSDKYTWLSEFKPRPDRSPVRPLPLDDKMQQKLAWRAIARAFDHAPQR
ncbi:endo-1,4-beta-xylanase [Dolichospermum sp. UHCC 0259]|uniref:endo-1,4-beta-xylanase n=1 Tax=Dolichospermum sp. UHCC 0259 TaxID=2590010 RepID=UPI0014480B8A|nr:endo-1,4-beta-xylanase [Dolichospermum sp. UHCC 0259]MTJ48419.1 endo-1,4-beta-xylanase [Dolichospermum sp. UHCC 0259]